MGGLQRLLYASKRDECWSPEEKRRASQGQRVTPGRKLNGYIELISTIMTVPPKAPGSECLEYAPASIDICGDARVAIHQVQ